MPNFLAIVCLSIALNSVTLANLKTVESYEGKSIGAINDFQVGLRGFGKSEAKNIKSILGLESKIQNITRLNQEIIKSAESYLANKLPIEIFHTIAMKTAYNNSFAAMQTLKSLETNYSDKNLHSYYLIRLHGFKLAQSIFSSFYSNTSMRRAFKNLLLEESAAKIFTALIKDYLSTSNRHMIGQYIERNSSFAEKNIKNIPGNDELDSSYNLAGFSDSIHGAKNSVTGTLSKGFGNMIGTINFRKGHLIYNKEAEIATQKNLKPMDILIFKYHFAFTDRTIPGYYSHVAIYLGTERELKDLGIWNNPSVKPYQDQIRAGATVLEALRSGIELNTLAEVLNADELMILRKKNLSKVEAKEVATRSISRLGGSYDFNFDIMTNSQVVCSEMTRYSFDTVRFPYQKVFGRFAIYPDHVAKVAFFSNSPLEFVSNTVGYEGQKFEITKDKESVAAKLNFVRGNGHYKENVEQCVEVKEKVYMTTPGGKGGGSYQNVTTKKCKMVLVEQVYKPL